MLIFVQVQTLPDVASIELQTEIQWFMRPYLLDFLIEAHLAFSLLPETLFLTINILDRYCSKRVVYKRHYQLVGCTALLIAAKYGDKKDRVPTLRELKGMCCSLYEEDMFVQMEWHVLETLKWTIGHPTVDAFLQMMLPCVNYTREDKKSENLAKYMLEIALFHKEFLSVRPSVMAKASLTLARHILGFDDKHAVDLMSDADTNVMIHLSATLCEPTQVLYRKYSQPEFDSVAVILEHFIARQQALAHQQHLPPTPPSFQYEYTPEPEVYTPRTDDEEDLDEEDLMTPPPQAQIYTPLKGGPTQHVGIVGVVTPPKTPEDYLTATQMEQQQACEPVSIRHHPYARHSSVSPAPAAYGYHQGPVAQRQH